MDTKGETNTMEKTTSNLKADDFAVGDVSNFDLGDIFLRDNNFTPEYIQELIADKDMNKRLVRKIDLIILPMLAGTYMLQYIDKSALAYSAVFDLFTDTGISQDQYSWLASIFYFAYLAAEYPWSYLAQKTSLAKVVSGCVMSWGVVLMTTAACKNFAGLAVCRFLLGVFEAPITPCFMMIISMWYLRDEQPFRAGIFYCCNGVGSMLGGLISFGIGQIHSFPVWRAIFLICGGVTIAWGALMMYILPGDIISAKRFTLEEKALLIGRGKLGRTGILNRQIKWYQIKEALLDPQVWLLTLFMLLNEVINGGIASFGKLIIKGLVSDPLLTTVLGIPQGAFQVFWILSGTWIASRFRNVRTLVMMVYLLPTVVGIALIWKLDRKAALVGVLFGYYIVGSYVTSLVLALQMPSTNLGGYTKRTTGVAIVFMAYCVGNIIGPHAFLSQESPTYPTGCIVILCCSATQVLISIALRVLLIRRNKSRDAAAAASGISESEGHAIEEVGADLTDFENPHFRYVY